MGNYLKKIEIHGFKSFPDKTIVQFHHGITAVIGPNGCGKSNLVDALLWVMGEQKMKNLRGDSSEDLIFNGSTTKKPLGMTEVDAYFQNDDKEVMIARRLFRSGENKYILNDKFCRNRDVQDALFELGIGERNYFILEQGSVEKIVSLKPTEKRILIEEAAGIAQYLERKKETANKLIVSQQNLDNLEVILTEKRNRLKELKNQVQFAQRYRKNKNTRNEHLKAILKKKFLKFKGGFDIHSKKLEDALNQETLLVKDITEIEKKIIQIEQKRWELEQRLKKNQQSVFEVHDRITNEKKESEKTHQRIDFIKSKVKELQVLNQSSQSEIGDQEKQITKIEDEKSNFEKQLKVEIESLQKIEKTMSGLNEQISQQKQKENGVKNALFNLQTEIIQNNNHILQLEKEFNQYEQDIVKKTNLREELEKQNSSVDLNTLQSEIKEMESRYQSQTEKLKVREKEHEHFLSELAQLEKELRQKLNEIDNLNSQKQKYLEIIEKLTTHKGQKEEGGSILSFQSQVKTQKSYHPILENFYFEEIDAPICENLEEAQKSKENKFILKTFNKTSIPEKVTQEEGFVGFIKNLFQFKDQDLKKSFKDGVLVDTLKNGIRISRAYDIDAITQKGELINRSGMVIIEREKGILDVLDEIDSIEKKMEDLTVQSSEIKARLEKMIQARNKEDQILQDEHSRIDQLKEQLIYRQSGLETQLKNREFNLNRIQVSESEIEILRDNVKKLKTELQKMKETKEKLNFQNEKLLLEKEKGKNNSDGITKEINEHEILKIQNEHAVNLLQEKMSGQTTRLKELQTHQIKISNRIKQTETELISLKKEISESENRITTMEAAIKEWNHDKEELEKTLVQDEIAFQDLNQKMKESSNKVSDQRIALEAIRENKKEIEIELATIKKDLFQLEDTANQELHSELKEIEMPKTLDGIEVGELELELGSLDQKLNKMRDSDRLNFSAESEYELLEKDHQFLISQREDILKSIGNLHDAITKIDRESTESFKTAFEHVKKNFIKNFKILFEGGEAELALQDEENLLETGLEIKAQPPGKQLQTLKLLSGGEKALASLAFLFALFEYKPSPFCVFDEVDASLDEANIQRFLKFLHKLKEKTQFVIITHNFKTMEEADYLYGISMDEPGVSKLYSMKMK